MLAGCMHYTQSARSLLAYPRAFCPGFLLLANLMAVERSSGSRPCVQGAHFCSGEHAGGGHTGLHKSVPTMLHPPQGLAVGVDPDEPRRTPRRVATPSTVKTSAQANSKAFLTSFSLRVRSTDSTEEVQQSASL
jgi:hypothetical protein